MAGRDWRMVKPCATCPFNTRGKGRALRDSLRPARWSEILRSLRREEIFTCHSTIDYDNEEGGESHRLRPNHRVCAGAIEWQRLNHCVPQYVQVCERLDAAAENRKAEL